MAASLHGGDDPSGSPPPPAPALAEEATGLRLAQAIETDGRYAADAYRFLIEGLEFTGRRIHGDAAYDETVAGDSNAIDARYHVNGAQLCLGLRDLASLRWGRLAPAVLNAWGIYATRDFGEIVFVLVARDLLHKTDNDSPADFAEVFPLSALERDYPMTCDRLDIDFGDEGRASLLNGLPTSIGGEG